MRRRKAGGGLSLIIFLIIAIAYSGFYDVLASLFVMGVFVALFAFLIFALAKANSNTNKSVPNQTVNIRRTIKDNSVRTNANSVSRVSKISTGDLNKIDNKLEKYFKNNITLPIVEGISLTTQSGKYTSVDQLYLTYKDEKITKLGDFKDTYIAVYERILELLLVFYDKSEEVIKAEVETPKPQPKKKTVINTAEKYIDKIDALNKEIPHEEITNGLYQTCDLLKQIDVLKQSKSDEDKVKKLYAYYLPILIDVLEKYKNLQDAPSEGDELKKCEAQLIKTIVLINEALKTICASMQEDDYMNINADISTLQSLLQKDGFGENPFKEKK